MDTSTFLRHVLPKQGQKILAVPKQYEKDGKTLTGWKYLTYPSATAAAEAAVQLDAKGHTVYFAVNGFGDWYEDAKGKRRLRTQDNVVACRSIYDDFDVDPADDKKYASREEALADIIHLAQALRLTPTITSSGGGYHCYFSLEEDISPDQWLWLSARKRDITAHLGMKVDRAVDVDSARILRPVGTHNRKTDTPRPVEVVKAGKVYPYDKLEAALRAYMHEHRVMPAPLTGKAKGENPFAAALGEFPPSSALEIAKHCAAIKGVADVRGDNVPEPLWRAVIAGTVKFCTEGEALAHEWSQGDTRYDQTECQAKIDGWNYGPASCETFDRLCGCRESCPHASRVKYPVQLGYTEESQVVEAPAEAPTSPAAKVVQIEGEVIPYWPDSGYRWSGAALAKSFREDDGTTHWRPFCRTFLYPVNRIRTEDGTWALHLRAREQNGTWRELLMPTSDLASTDMMAKTLAQYEIFLFYTKHARGDMAEYLMGMTERLQQYRIETKTYEKFGWTDNYNGFVMGTTMIRPDKEEDVICGPGVPRDIAVDFGTKGTLEEWIANTDRMLNRPGAEIMQFVLCHAIGSSLVEILGSSNWHGLPVSLVGPSGHGKSTISKIACGFYGKPSLFEKQGNEDGATIGAAIKRIFVMGTLPSVLDEMSGRKPEDLTRIGYALGNGRDKERLRSNGQFATIGDEMFKNSIANSNDSTHDAIAQLPSGFKVEATQLRFFEVPLPEGYIHTVFSDIDRNFVEHHMDNVYGHACRPFLRFVMKNRDWVRRQMVTARQRFNPQSQEETKERFYIDCIVTALVAGKIAQKLGLIHFNVKAMTDWALSHVTALRETRTHMKVDPSAFVAQMVASLQGRVLITKYFGDGRTNHEVPIAQLRYAPVARIATEDKRVFVSSKYVADWCREHDVPPKIITNELERTGHLLKTVDGKPSAMKRLGSGTTEASTPTRCYELDYNLLYGTGIPTLRVVQTEQPVTEAVTG